MSMSDKEDAENIIIGDVRLNMACADFNQPWQHEVVCKYQKFEEKHDVLSQDLEMV